MFHEQWPIPDDTGSELDQSDHTTFYSDRLTLFLLTTAVPDIIDGKSFCYVSFYDG